MRYLLHKTQFSELQARREYLYDIFHLCFFPGKPEGSYIPLIPVGIKGPDVLFITGHTDYVLEYMEQYYCQIPERNIVITSCMGQKFKKYASQKSVIYTPNSNSIFCCLHNGIPYGFNFDISDAELNFYNAEGNIWSRLKVAYHRI